LIEVSGCFVRVLENIACVASVSVELNPPVGGVFRFLAAQKLGRAQHCECIERAESLTEAVATQAMENRKTNILSPMNNKSDLYGTRPES